ncbi:MAG: hypothetical protein KH138_04815 [Firmicutes bacterium]|nr:hypothetical protein [Bacillota bacterium]
MGKTIDFQQQKDLRVWRTVMEELRVIQNLEPWTFLGPEDTFLYLPKAENRWIFFRWVPAAPNEVVLTVYPSLLSYRKSLETPQTYRESTRNFIESSYFEIYQTKAEDIPAALRSVYRELRVDHGDGLWPFVTYKRWGYDEALPQGRHLLLLENALGNLFMQLRAVEAKPGSVDFTKGEMCVRFYSPDQGMWVNAAMPYSLPPKDPPFLQLNQDSTHVTQPLLDLPRSQTLEQVDFDFGWLDDSDRKNGGAPLFPHDHRLYRPQDGQPSPDLPLPPG